MLTKSAQNEIAGVAFDAVGTLIEPFPSVADVYLAAAARQSVRLDRAEVFARFGRHFRDDEVDEVRGAMATDEAMEFRRWRRIVAAVLPEVSDPGRAFEELWAHFARADSWRCFPDVAPVIRSLKAKGVRVCIASNFDARLRGVIAGLPEVAGLADSLVISSEVGCRKPHPDFYRAVRETLGVEPSRTLFVGDDAENDARGPIRAGMRALLVGRRGSVESVDGADTATGLAHRIESLITLRMPDRLA